MNRREFIKGSAAGSLGALAFAPNRGEGQGSIENHDAGNKIRVAVVQMETVPGAVSLNRTKALKYAAEALRHNADIILFHEECMVGYAPNLRDLAEPQDGPTSREFQSLLQGSDSRVLWGLTERAGKNTYIAATLVSSSRVEANYRKTHLWWHTPGIRDETKSYEPGEELVTFDIKGHKCGVMICYDGDFPEMTRCYANLNCGVLFWMNNRNQRGYGEVKAHAETNSIIMPTACCSGKDEASIDCPGGSNITNYDGTLLAEIWNKEGIIYANIDPTAALLARKTNPWYRGRRPLLYSRYP